MALNPDYDYDKILSLTQAKLVERTRLNSLGSYEITLNYNQISSTTKEDCVEWLEANRLTITDPEFSFKTYEGTWLCVSISYNEDRSIIQQSFKIDSSMQDDVAQRSSAGTTLRDYYWRVVDPRDYNIPAWTTGGTSTPDLSGEYWYDTHVNLNGETVYSTSDKAYSLWYDGSDWYVTVSADVDTTPTNYFKAPTIDGTYTAFGSFTGSPEIGFDDEYEWSKTANDNGDGTYDVIITKSLVNNQTGSSESLTGGESESGSTSIFVSGGRVDGVDQEYALYYEYYGHDEIGTAPAAIATQYYDTGTTENGEPVYYNSADSYAIWYNGSSYYITVVADVGGTPTNYLEAATLQEVYVGYGTLSGEEINIISTLIPLQASAAGSVGTIYAEWRGVTDSDWVILWEEIQSSSGLFGWRIKSSTLDYADHPYTSLNSSEWYLEDSWSGSTYTDYMEYLIVQIGKNPPAVSESSTIYTSSEEVSFVSDGGTIPDPVDGEEKTISNIPIDNGKFRVTITTRTVSKMRVPALFGAVVYASAGDRDQSAVVSATNATYAEFQADLNYMRLQKLALNNTVSVNINRYGRYDYTIRSIDV